MKDEILAILDSLKEETGLDREILVKTVEDAVHSATQKKFGERKRISVSFEDKTGEIKITMGKKQISLENLGRIGAQNARQAIIKEIRQKINEKIYSTYHSRIAEVLSGKIVAMDGDNFIVDLGEAEGLLPRKECLPQENFAIGDNVRAYLLDIEQNRNFAPLFLSRTHRDFLKKLFWIEIPELREGIIEIRFVVREPGYRAKIAVESHMRNVDSVGTCIWLKGGRIRSIIEELKGEKIDIIPYDEDIKTFITRAVAPAQVLYTQIFPEDKRARIIVKDDQLSLAIGKKGQNVRLAAQLTGWKLDIRSETQVEEEKSLTPQEIEKKLREIPQVGKTIASRLAKSGFITINDVARAKVQDLLLIEGLGKNKASQIIKGAKEMVEKEGKNL